MATAGRADGATAHAARAAEVRRLHELARADPVRRGEVLPAFHAAVRAFETPVRELLERLRDGDAAAAGEAVAFLEADPRCFRSGYLRAEVMHWLANHADLAPYRDRVQAVVLHRLRHRDTRLLRHAARLAAEVWDDDLRGRVEALLDDPDERVRTDAARLLERVSPR